MTIVGKVVPNTKEKRELEIAVKVGGADEDAGDEVDADVVGGEDDDVDVDDDGVVGGEDEEDAEADAATLGADPDAVEADEAEADADVESSFGEGDSFDGGDDFSSVASSGGDDVVDDN